MNGIEELFKMMLWRESRDLVERVGEIADIGVRWRWDG